MTVLFLMFVIVAVIIGAVSFSISRFTNKTINSVMKQMPVIGEQNNHHAQQVFKTTPRNASDKKVIDVAVANNGKVTATILCAKLDISVDEATAKLEDLHTKGVFELESTTTGHLVYKLVDLDLMR